MQRLTTAGLQGVGGNVVIARPAGIIDGVDQEATGAIDRIDVDRLTTFLKEGMLPVVGPLGYDQRGQMLRVNSDAVALAIATELKAEKLLFITDDKITGEDEQRLRHLPVIEDDGSLVGLLSARDMLRLAVSDSVDMTLDVQNDIMQSTRVSDVMTLEPISVEPDQRLIEAAELMLEMKLGCLPVTEGSHLVGILTEADFVRRALENG